VRPSFAGRIIDVLAESGVEQPIRGHGAHHDAIVSRRDRRRPSDGSPTFVRNPNPARGQLSSLWVGMDHAITPISRRFW
jgi:CTP:molybdopterin cytidylyltransferase MocA